MPVMSDYDLIYEKEEFRSSADEAYVRKVLDYVCPMVLDGGIFSVSFVSEDTIHQENLEYRNIDSPTDILTFALEDSAADEPFFIPQEEAKEWGDILICLDKMKENAERFNQSESDELARLLIHGLLHLSGMDHETNDFDREEMLIKQEEILRKLKESL